MKLLFLDPHGDGLDIALRAQRDGHQVRYFVRQDPHNKYTGRGLVEVINDYKPWVRWADLVLMADNTLYLHDFDQRWRKEGVKVIGPTAEAAAWEIDRAAGMKVLEKHDIPVADYKIFNDYDKAIAYVKREDRRFVSKPCGDDDKALSYCAKSPEDLVYMLQRWKKLGKLKTEFLLQEFISGTEMAVGAWFGPGGFNRGWCENFEFKKLMNNDMGVATGEQGTVMRYVKTSKLANKVLAPLAEALEALNYCGYIDVNCIIDDKGIPYPLEFTMRPGWPTFNIQQALITGDSVEWLMDLHEGTDARNWSLDRIAAGVVLSIPDYPYSRLTGREVAGIPVYGADKHPTCLHPCQMMLAIAPQKIGGVMVDVPMLCTAGDYVAVMTATGDTVKEATDLVYRRLGTLMVPNSPMYRTDIGTRLKKQLPALHRNGYAMGLEYSEQASSNAIAKSL